MRRIAVVLVALVLATPAGAAPRGAPKTLRPARAADHASRGAALSEDWTLRLADPRSTAWIEVTATRNPEERRVRIRGADASGREFNDGFGAEPHATRRALDAASAEGALAVRGGGRRTTLTGPVANGTVRLRRIARGPAGLDWRLGKPEREPQKPITANWSMLIATSRAKGALTLNDGRRFDLDGWRGSYEHGWGDILPGDVEWDYLDSAIVHGKPGQAWVVRGLNRTDTVTGPGARDAQWLGFIARVNGGHVKICRPRIDRRGWLFTYPDFAMWATRLRARCGGISIRLRDRRQTAIDEFVDHLEVRARTRTRTGLVTHISHPKR